MIDAALPYEHHLKLLRLLEANPDMSQRDLARELGISLGKTNYCIKHLLDKGFIKMQNFRNSHNKLAYAYLLTPTGFTAKVELTLRFLKHKVNEYEKLKSEIELLQLEALNMQNIPHPLSQENC
ncbi:MarR family EPS-associated transcriptional regulator [Pusillimonas sp. SM2304]|uniref:MarR family EPS-associated transcriptional regulator n=1 Tax=Pusillimonas sp. SM2304 TaxID=3073241 RepID=UPI0028768A64|nr:MarR family EPS-associated transcriptional regulator [Pusillimonas sp. SM2304]MDS1140037.1 MarR family EPS-associated transcriptional regulator [Pusillimonas sp. SM2304]